MRLLGLEQASKRDVRVHVDIIGYDDRGEPFFQDPLLLSRWSEDGVVLHDIVSVETSTGQTYRF